MPCSALPSWLTTSSKSRVPRVRSQAYECWACLDRLLNIACSSRVEKEPEDWTDHDQTYMVGLCTGLLSAAAIASTPTVSTLIPLAIQAVLLAFRTGVYVGGFAERFCSPLPQSESWTMIFPGVGEEEANNAISKFHLLHVSIEASLLQCVWICSDEFATEYSPGQSSLC